MCGIVGVLTHRDAVGDNLDVLPGLVDLMARRGPDDAGMWTDHAHLALGFRRLAVIDPTPVGHQPMVSEDGRYALAFNGEIYNFRELRRRLEDHGARFRTRSDTEVVLHALRVWGEAALQRFNGMFALASYDATTRTLLLARDPLGIKPLYYLAHPRGLVFGSQYDQLLRHPFCDRSRVQPEVLSLFLRFGYVPPPYGLLAGTHQLDPGTYLRVRAGSEPEIHRFHRLPEPGPAYLRGREAVDAVADAVQGAVRRQMVSDVAIGSFLSGGVDSPLVTAHMQAASAAAVPAFTIGSNDPALDESAPARAYSRALGVEHHLRCFDASDALALIGEVATAYSEPFADHSALPTMLVSSLARERVKVALSGDGGDELFWGYPRFRKVVGARRYFRYPRALRALAYGAGKWGPGTRPPRGVLFESIGRWYQDSHSGLRSHELTRLCPAAVGTPRAFDLYEMEALPDHVGLAQWLRHNELRGHLQMLLLKVDRASMYHGLEARVPLLDLEVLDCAARVHPNACLGDDTGKLVLRQALARCVPPELIPRQKRGFDVPVGRWLRRELAPHVHELLLERDPFPQGLFSRPALRKYASGHLDGTHDRAQGLWTLLSLQLWADTHLTPATSAAAGRPSLATMARP